MRFLFGLLITLIPFFAFSQTGDSTKTGSIRGEVKDSINDYALQYVTVTIYKKADSSVVDYQLSNNSGIFNFQKLPLSTPLIVNLSFTGYKPFYKDITLDSANRGYDFKQIFMTRGYGTLEEVVVQAVLPVRMNGDTLEINPAAFKLDSNAVVEDMLRRVPGVTMWGDGTITVNGKTVNNVYVDGKPFFSSDPTIATQNLPKNAIEKIQVYQEQDYSKDNLDIAPSDSLLTMNIKLKPDKKMGYFGKAGAGIGTDKRYEADLTLQAYNKRTRAGLAGATNNINKNADMQSIFQQSAYRNYNPSNRYVANFGGQGVTAIQFLGANLQHSFTENTNSWISNQLNASYNIRRNINDANTLTNSRNSASGTVFLNESKRQSNSSNLSNSVNTSYNNRDRNKDFSIDASFNTNENNGASTSSTVSEKEGAGMVSKSTESSTSHSQNQNFNINTRFRNRGDDERNLKSFSINNSLSFGNNESERNTKSDFTSLDDATKSKKFDRLYNNTFANFNNSFGINYNALKRLLFGSYNLWNINIGVNNDLNVSKSKYQSRVSDRDTLTGIYATNNYLTNNNEVARVEDRPSLNFSKSFNKNLTDRFARYINFSANLRGQFLSEDNSSNIANRNLHRSYGFFIPGMSVNYNYNRFNKYQLNFDLSQNRSAAIPSIDQLYPIIDSTNLYSFNYGNPDLSPSYTNSLNFNFNYNQQNRQKKNDINFGINASIGNINNAIADSSLYDNLGRRNVYLINIDGRKFINAGGNVSYSIKMKKDILQFNYSGNFSNSVSPNYIDGIYSISNNDNITNNLTVFYSLGEMVTFRASQAVNFNTNKQSGKNLTSFKNTNYITQGSINLKYPKDFTLSNTFNYVKNNSTSQSSALWNAFATYRFLKSKSAEVKLSAMDILRQNKNIATYAGANNLTTTISNGLQQFYMVTLSYFPRRFGASASRNRGGGEQRGGGNRSGGRPGGGGQRGRM